MAHLAVTVALLVLACVCAAPAPNNPQFALAKDIGLGFAAADNKSKANGLVESVKILETPIKAPVDTGNTVPDFSAVEKFNAGAAFANNGSIANGVTKFTEIGGSPTKGLEGIKKAGFFPFSL